MGKKIITMQRKNLSNKIIIKKILDNSSWIDKHQEILCMLNEYAIGYSLADSRNASININRLKSFQRPPEESLISQVFPQLEDPSQCNKYIQSASRESSEENSPPLSQIYTHEEKHRVIDIVEKEDIIDLTKYQTETSTDTNQKRKKEKK